jgi:hypothetical protein
LPATFSRWRRLINAAYYPLEKASFISCHFSTHQRRLYNLTLPKEVEAYGTRKKGRNPALLLLIVDARHKPRT